MIFFAKKHSIKFSIRGGSSERQVSPLSLVVFSQTQSKNHNLEAAEHTADGLL